VLNADGDSWEPVTGRQEDIASLGDAGVPASRESRELRNTRGCQGDLLASGLRGAYVHAEKGKVSISPMSPSRQDHSNERTAYRLIYLGKQYSLPWTG
jgi:hypothetical protein